MMRLIGWRISGRGLWGMTNSMSEANAGSPLSTRRAQNAVMFSESTDP